MPTDAAPHSHHPHPPQCISYICLMHCRRQAGTSVRPNERLSGCTDGWMDDSFIVNSHNLRKTFYGQQMPCFFIFFVFFVFFAFKLLFSIFVLSLVPFGAPLFGYNSQAHPSVIMHIGGRVDMCVWRTHSPDA